MDANNLHNLCYFSKICYNNYWIKILSEFNGRTDNNHNIHLVPEEPYLWPNTSSEGKPAKCSFLQHRDRNFVSDCTCKSSIADIFLQAQSIRGIKDNVIREQLQSDKKWFDENVSHVSNINWKESDQRISSSTSHIKINKVTITEIIKQDWTSFDAGRSTIKKPRNQN